MNLDRARPALREHGPLLVVVLALGALGAWGNAVGLADPGAIGPRTLFTPGQYLAAAIARAQVEAHGSFSTVTELLGWPDEAEFRVVMWPTQLLALVVGALPAVNLVFAFGPALNAVCGGVLGRALGLDRWGRAALGGLVGWSPWVRETLLNGQLEQVVVGVVALQWAVAIVAARRGAPGWIALSALTTWGAGMTAPHLCLAACLGMAAQAATSVALAGPDRGRTAARWAAILALSAVAAVLANRYHTPNFAGGVQVFFPKGSDGHPANLPGLPEQATLFSLLLPPTDRPSDITALHPTYLGLVGVLAAAWTVARRRELRPALLPMLAALALLALFSFGPEMPLGRTTIPGPYALLGLLSSSVSASASAYRVVGAATVALAVLAAGLARGPRTLAALVLLGWVETTVTSTRPLPFAPMDFTPDPVSAPFRAGAGAVLDLPLIGPDCPISPYHHVFEAARRLRPTPILPAAPGFYPTVPGLVPRVQGVIRGRSCAEGLSELVPGLGFTAVVLHTHDPTCKVSPALTRCLTDAFGEGRSAPGMRWWDPLPPAPSGAAPGSLFPARPPAPTDGTRPAGAPSGAPP